MKKKLLIVLLLSTLIMSCGYSTKPESQKAFEKQMKMLKSNDPEAKLNFFVSPDDPRREDISAHLDSNNYYNLFNFYKKLDYEVLMVEENKDLDFSFILLNVKSPKLPNLSSAEKINNPSDLVNGVLKNKKLGYTEKEVIIRLHKLGGKWTFDPLEEINKDFLDILLTSEVASNLQEQSKKNTNNTFENKEYTTPSGATFKTLNSLTEDTIPTYKMHAYIVQTTSTDKNEMIDFAKTHTRENDSPIFIHFINTDSKEAISEIVKLKKIEEFLYLKNTTSIQKYLIGSCMLFPVEDEIWYDKDTFVTSE